MKYAAEKGSSAMIYIYQVSKDWFRHSKVSKGVFTDTQIWRSHMPTFIFSK
jgi:hypothetical protein